MLNALEISPKEFTYQSTVIWTGALRTICSLSAVQVCQGREILAGNMDHWCWWQCLFLSQADAFVLVDEGFGKSVCGCEGA